LSVDITESTAPDGTEYVTFTDYVSHRQCSTSQSEGLAGNRPS
jgi:hypothetical protein